MRARDLVSGDQVRVDMFVVQSEWRCSKWELFRVWMNGTERVLM